MQTQTGKPVTPLSARRIVIPETRQLDILAALVQNRGGEAVRVPLVSIHDSPHQELVTGWIQQFIESPPALFIIFTGEGLRRLLGTAERADCRDAFIRVLGEVPLLTRGPKPVRVLTDIGIKPAHTAAEPTTRGVITTLDGIELEDQAVALQLYGEEPNQELQDYLTQRQSVIRAVAPYVYASESETGLVKQCILDLAEGNIDMIAFTSQPQLRRLQQVARQESLERELAEGLSKTAIAAVGPVVREQIEAAGYSVAVMPQKQYFMKPLVTAMVNYFSLQDAR